ncbi:hypothetical protein [Halalkalibacter alkalisediminis]|nr:hypothetical protein [Halalkalibacter alkalisediminis]
MVCSAGIEGGEEEVAEKRGKVAGITGKVVEKMRVAGITGKVVEKMRVAEKRGRVAGIGQEVDGILGNVAEIRTDKKPLPNIQQWSL